MQLPFPGLRALKDPGDRRNGLTTFVPPDNVQLEVMGFDTQLFWVCVYP